MAKAEAPAETPTPEPVVETPAEVKPPATVEKLAPGSFGGPNKPDKQTGPKPWEIEAPPKAK